MYTSKHHQRTCDGQTGVRVIVPATHRASTNHFFIRNCAQSAPVAVAIISRSKSNYDQFGFARIRTNIKRFALKFGARCMGCVPISRVERFVCLFESTMTSVAYMFKRSVVYRFMFGFKADCWICRCGSKIGERSSASRSVWRSRRLGRLRWSPRVGSVISSCRRRRRPTPCPLRQRPSQRIMLYHICPHLTSNLSLQQVRLLNSILILGVLHPLTYWLIFLFNHFIFLITTRIYRYVYRIYWKYIPDKFPFR